MAIAIQTVVRDHCLEKKLEYICSYCSPIHSWNNQRVCTIINIWLAIQNTVFSVTESVTARPRDSEFSHPPLLETWVTLITLGFITWNVSNTWKHHPQSLIHRHPTLGRKLISESFCLLCWVTASSSCLDFNLEQMNFHHKTMHLTPEKQEQKGKT